MNVAAQKVTLATVLTALTSMSVPRKLTTVMKTLRVRIRSVASAVPAQPVSLEMALSARTWTNALVKTSAMQMRLVPTV